MRRVIGAAVVVIVVLVVIGMAESGPSKATAAESAESATIAGNIKDALGLGATVTMANGDVFVVTASETGQTADQLCRAILAVTNDPATGSPLPLNSVAMLDKPNGSITAQCRR